MLACVIFIFLGCFGYFTFSDRPEVFDNGNLFDGDYKRSKIMTIV